MSHEQLFASFMLDRRHHVEIALKAEYVNEATPVQGRIQALPGGIPFLEGIMNLRDDVIPVINLKKRLGFAEHDYDSEAKVAVVSLFNQRYGLLFEDIREVFRADSERIVPIGKNLQTEDRIISALIKLEGGKRAVELLDLDNLFDATAAGVGSQPSQADPAGTPRSATTYSRFVVIRCDGQEYGIPVELSREITFFSDINDMYRTGVIEGALDLRGGTIPVINTHALLSACPTTAYEVDENTRILILACDDCSVGIIVDEVREIISIPDNEILPFPPGNTAGVTGLYPRREQRDIILLNMPHLIRDHLDTITSMARIGGKTGDNEHERVTGRATNHHLITEHCYLVFSIGKHFAIEIKDVKEILDNAAMMSIPGIGGYNAGVINLRGEVVPVVNLRTFYRYPERESAVAGKLIICTAHGRTVALEVDQIVTIYKQERYHATPSLGAQLQDKKDTVDRLIEYADADGLKEHVLVINTRSLIRNHLTGADSVQPPPEEAARPECSGTETIENRG